MSYNSHHATKSPHLTRVRRLAGFNRKSNKSLVTLICTRGKQGGTHPSQDLEEWSKFFKPENTHAINKDWRMRSDVAKYHPGVQFYEYDAVRLMSILAGEHTYGTETRKPVIGMYYLDLMCTFETLRYGGYNGNNGHYMRSFFKRAELGTVIIINCCIYAGRRNAGELSDVPEEKQEDIIQRFKNTFADVLGNWEYVGKDFYQSASKVRTPMMSIIFRRK
jgi:hypothetical protein